MGEGGRLPAPRVSGSRGGSPAAALRALAQRPRPGSTELARDPPPGPARPAAPHRLRGHGAHPDSRVPPPAPPQPGSRAPLPPSFMHYSGFGACLGPSSIRLNRRAGPGARIARWRAAALTLHGAGEGRRHPPAAAAAGVHGGSEPRTPPPSPARGFLPTGNLPPPPPPRLSAAERGRMWRSRACSVAAPRLRLPSPTGGLRAPAAAAPSLA